MDVAERVRMLREAAGLSKGELGRRADLSESYIGQIESTKKHPTVDTIFHICKGLGITIQEFFAIDQDLSTLPPDIWDLVSKKENHGLLKLIKAMTDKKYTIEVIEEWIMSLDKALESIKKKYGIMSLKDQVLWVDEELLPESARGKFTEEEKLAIIEKLKAKQQDQSLKLPWEK